MDKYEIWSWVWLAVAVLGIFVNKEVWTVGAIILSAVYSLTGEVVDAIHNKV